MVARMPTERVFGPENCMGLVIYAARSFPCKRRRPPPKGFWWSSVGEERAAWAGLSLGWLHSVQGILLFSALFSEQPALSLCTSPSFHDRNDKFGGCSDERDWESPAGRRQSRSCCPRPPAQGIQDS